MDKKIALVTNVLDYVGPPAVTALIAEEYQVVAQDHAFQKTDCLHAYQQQIPGIDTVGIIEPRELVDHLWSKYKKIDVLVSNDTYPAIHGPIAEAKVENLQTDNQ